MCSNGRVSEAYVGHYIYFIACQIVLQNVVPLPLNTDYIIQSYTSYLGSNKDFLTLKLIALFSHNTNS